MRPIRTAFLAGLAALVAGLAVFFSSYLIGPAAAGATKTLQIALSLAGLLLASAGGFLFLCTGAVVLAGLLTQPRASKARG